MAYAALFSATYAFLFAILAAFSALDGDPRWGVLTVVPLVCSACMSVGVWLLSMPLDPVAVTVASIVSVVVVAASLSAYVGHR